MTTRSYRRLKKQNRRFFKRLRSLHVMLDGSHTRWTDEADRLDCSEDMMRHTDFLVNVQTRSVDGDTSDT